MRTIKFRIYNTKAKEWVQGPHKQNSMDGCNLFGETILFGYLLDGVPLENHADCVPLQYIGVDDKNGKGIFEGDILSSSVNEKPCNYIVKWSENRSEYCGFVLNPVMKNPPKVTYHIHDFKLWMAEGFEVIGNIYDNPELIK